MRCPFTIKLMSVFMRMFTRVCDVIVTSLGCSGYR